MRGFLQKCTGIFSFILVFSSINIQAQDKQARMMVHLLDYISVDYSMAVKDGQVISEGEYSEMQEFAASVIRIGTKTPDSIQADISLLDSLILSKASLAHVSSLATSIKQNIISLYNIKLSPKNWPSLVNGEKLFALHCQSCHGREGKGDGVLAPGLEPSPTNFHDPDKANGLSPFQAYNTIRLGVQGTGMRGFNELNDEQTWDLAFYALSLAHKNKGIKLLKSKKNITEEVNLELLASSNNEELTTKLKLDPNQPSLISVLRLFPQEMATTDEKPNYLETAKNLILQSQQAYANGNKEDARTFALTAYLEGVEPIEMQLSASDATFVGRLEGQLSKMRGFIENGKTIDEVNIEASLSIQMLDEAQDIIAQKTFSSWLTFTLSSTIILREGLEAFLVIITILGIIRALKLPGAARWIHGGWIAAILAGFLMWLAADSLFTFSGAQRELMEGFIALFAVVILLYVGFWMHSKSEAGKWQAYVKNKIQKLASKENMFGLSFLSFIVVFREAFESVLFLSALSVEAGEAHQAALGGGILVAFLLLGLISVLLLKYSKKIPITQLFKYSAIIISFLTVVLVGKGLHALQEAGAIGISSTPFNLRIDLLGVYPTFQTLIAQVFTLALVLFLWKIGSKPLAKKEIA